MKLTFLLFLATITNTAAASNRTRRFLHADRCDIKAHPSIVSITNMQSDTNNTKYAFGTGNLITMKWIITYSEVFYFGNYSNSKVMAGTNYELPGETDDFRIIKRTVIHQKYGGDLTLCELDKPFTQNDRIQPAKLPAEFLIAQLCETLTVVGWGTSSDAATSRFYKDVVGRGDLLKCGKGKKASCDRFYSDKFCYDMKDSSQQCNTDKGLGVFCKDILVGVTTGITSETFDECTSNGGEASDLIHYMSWLQENTGIEMPTTSEDVTTADIDKPSTPLHKHTSEKYRGLFISQSTTEETSEISKGQHIKPNCFIYLLFICLLLFL